MSLNNSTYTQSLGIPFTQYVTSSAGHALVSSSTYFNDTSDNVPRYKDANGNVIEPFVSSSYAVTSSYALTAEAGGGTGAAVAFPWKFKDPTAAADPGSGHFRLNSTSSSAITEIYVSDNTSNGIDASNLLNIIDTSTRIYLQQNDDASRALLFSVSSAPTDNTGWFTIPVTYLQGSQIPKKDKICGWILARSGSGGGTDTNFANTDLTFTADRNHNSAGNNFFVSADGLGDNSSNAYLGYDFTSLMGTVLTSSYLGVGDTYVIVATGFVGSDYIQLTSEGTSSMYTVGGVDGGVYFGDNVEKAMVVSTVTDNVSIGKNTSNAKLDVNGNTIISGSLTVTGLTEETGSNAVAMYDSASGQLYYASTYQGSTTNTTVGGGTTTETGITAVSAAERTIPANSVKPGDMFNIKAYGTLEGKSSDCDIRLRIGGALGVLILSASNLDPNGQHDWKIDADMIIRSTGASGQIYSAGSFSANQGDALTPNQFIVTQSLAQKIQNIDTTTDTEIDLTVQFVGSAFDNITTEMFKMTKLH